LAKPLTGQLLNWPTGNNNNNLRYDADNGVHSVEAAKEPMDQDHSQTIHIRVKPMPFTMANIVANAPQQHCPTK